VESREPRPQKCAEARVPGDETFRWTVSSHRFVLSLEPHARFRLAEHGALEGQESHLIGRIDDPQLSAELEAIDDHRLTPEADVLGPQITVTFNDPSPAVAVDQRFWPGAQEVDQTSSDPID
jgi:hypothetical protein